MPCADGQIRVLKIIKTFLALLNLTHTSQALTKKINQYPDFGSSPSHPFVRGLRRQDFPSQLRDSDGISPFFPSDLMII